MMMWSSKNGQSVKQRTVVKHLNVINHIIAGFLSRCVRAM